MRCERPWQTSEGEGRNTLRADRAAGCGKLGGPGRAKYHGETARHLTAPTHRSHVRRYPTKDPLGRRRDRPAPAAHQVPGADVASPSPRCPTARTRCGALAQSRFDVVLLDEMMPGLGGLATLDAIKSRDLSVPVILVTKSEEETLMEEAIGRRITRLPDQAGEPLAGVAGAASACWNRTRIQDVAARRATTSSEMQRWQSLDRRGFELERLGRAGGGDGALGRAASTRCARKRAGAGARRLPPRAQHRLRPLHRGELSAAGCTAATPRPLLSTDVVAHAVAPLLKARRARGVHRHRLHAPRPVAHARAVARGAASRSVASTTARSCRPPRPTRATPSSPGCCRPSSTQRHPDLWQENSNDERTQEPLRAPAPGSPARAPAGAVRRGPSSTSRSTTPRRRSRRGARSARSRVWGS
mgnify:CR=1 FL=1